MSVYSLCDDGLIVEVSEDRRYVVVSFEPPHNVGELRTVVSAGKNPKDEWVILMACDLNCCNLQEAVRYINAFNALVAEIQEIDPGVKIELLERLNVECKRK